MSEEQIVKDGLLYFNPPDKNKRKPNVIYYSSNSDTTGIDYEKPNGDVKKKFTQTTWFKVVMTITGMAALLSIISVIYFLVVKLRKRASEPAEEIQAVEADGNSTVYEDVVSPLPHGEIEKIILEEPKEKNFIRKYFESLLPESVRR